MCILFQPVLQSQTASGAKSLQVYYSHSLFKTVMVHSDEGVHVSMSCLAFLCVNMHAAVKSSPVPRLVVGINIVTCFD